MNSENFGCILIIIAFLGLLAIPTVAPWWAALAWLGFILVVALIVYVVRAVTHRSRD